MNMYNNTYSKEYAKGLAQYGFTYHNIIRTEHRVNHNKVDWYLNNLLKARGIDMAFACIEPDIDEYTFNYSGSNHIHFAWRGDYMNTVELSKRMRCRRAFIRDTHQLENSMSYFTKHLGTNLSYHNIYV